jgi:hypothetical protein
MKFPTTIRDEAAMDGYIFFDKNIRLLPKRPDGSIDTLQPGFSDNDVDAFRHAYVSGVFTHEYGEKTAALLGWINELMPSSDSGVGRNMDLWNNEIGRKLALKHKTQVALLKGVKSALQTGQLITTPSDERVYEGAVLPKPEGDHTVIVLEQSESGANSWFFDIASSKTMSRKEFVHEINAGNYRGYTTRRIGDIDFPVSKGDGLAANNLG